MKIAQEESKKVKVKRQKLGGNPILLKIGFPSLLPFTFLLLPYLAALRLEALAATSASVSSPTASNVGFVIPSATFTFVFMRLRSSRFSLRFCFEFSRP